MRRDPRQDADAARPHDVREGADPRAEDVAEHDEREREDDALPDLIERDRRDRTDRPRRSNQHARAVEHLRDHATDLVLQGSRGSSDRHRRQVGVDPRRDRRGREPAQPGDHHDRRRSDRTGDLSTDEDADEEREGAAHRRERVRHQQVLDRHQPRHDRGGGREVEAVDRQHDQRAQVERHRLPDRIEQHQADERHLQQGRERQDPSPPPSVDEHADERSEQRERQRGDHRGLEQAHRGAVLGRGEHHRGDQRGLEAPVAGLAGQADREEAPEILTAERPADAGDRSLGRGPGHRPGGAPLRP